MEGLERSPEIKLLLRQIAVVTIPVFLALMIGYYLNLSANQMGILGATTGVSAAFLIEMHIRGYTKWQILEKLFPGPHERNRS